MIKSNFWAMGLWMMALVSLTFLLLFISSISKYYFDIQIFKISMRNPSEAHLEMGTFVIAFLLFGSIFMSGANQISIDTSKKTVSFRNIITQKLKVYSFNELDGYVDTLQRDGRGASYKTIYLVKNEKYIAKISTFFCSNFDNLKSGLSDLNYLGFKDFGLIESFKVLFGMKIL